MQWSLFLLVLMGQCLFYSCRLYEYRLIEEAKTWIEAQRYCRERHSDLATVTDMADTHTLKKMMRKRNVTEAWIGLQSHKGKDNRTWHWSLPGVESDETQFEKHWESGQPNDARGQSTESCAQILKGSHKWNDGNCGSRLAFICYNDADQNDPFKVVDTPMTWTQAQKYCRKNHTDLISGLDQLEKFSKASGSQFDKLWIGLFRDTWRWSNGSNSSFRNWRFGKFKNGITGNECATVIDTSGQWSSAVCTETKPFFCYKGQCFFSTCHEYHLIEEAKTWIEAQSHCREHNSDLATVTNMADTQKLKEMMRKKNVPEAWIGLQSHKGKDNRAWHWSLPGVESHEMQFKKHWKRGEPNDAGQSTENCAQIIKGSHKWNDGNCESRLAFICYNDTDQNDSFKVVDTPMTWTKAQKYCRKNHTDLISGLDQLEKFSKASGSQFDKLWIGLFRDTWRWSDRSKSSLRNWRFGKFKNGITGNECATVTNTSGQWSSAVCTETKPFFCYDDKAVLVQEKLNWEEALYYCQEKYDDLVAITDGSEQRWAQAKAKNATTSHVWLGLRYTCTLDFWFWVSDEVVRYENWGPNEGKDKCDLSGAMSREGAHEWEKTPDNQEFNFICSKP